MIKSSIGRAFVCALALTSANAALSAQISIGGVTAGNAQIPQEKIETKYGTFSVKGGFPAERYESGAVKSFYIEDFGQPVRISYPSATFGAIFIETPVPGTDYLSQKNAQPAEFYENGNLKTVRLANVKYDSLGGDNYLHISFEKYNESLAIFPKSVIRFYENGNIESVKVAADQSFKFLRDLRKNEKTKAVFKNQSEVFFYESGAVKEFVPQGANYPNPLNFSLKLGTSVVVSEDDPTKLLSFYPGNGSALVLGDGIKVTCIPGEPLVFYEDGKTLKQISWTFENVNFTLGNVRFYFNPKSDFPPNTTSQIVSFSETGAVKSMKAVKGSDFPALVENKVVAVNQVDYDENGEITMAYFAESQILSEIETKDGIQTIFAWKIYYKEGKRNAALGCAVLQSSRGSFYNTNYNCAAIFDADKIRTVKISELSAKDSFIFDESGNPAAVLISSSGKIIEIE
ncbi:MAG: hypothetical protein NC041_06910 [Bacteroides sp.]|nr:hypothetical protein [Prevotella sp.]MCM1407026.1 hypothetical protein [Treponema brennaborense]MCM1470178.1 hypothetical protein [Bacteroides sp.]